MEKNKKYFILYLIKGTNKCILNKKKIAKFN